jgi:hypothetical protein
LSEQHGDPSGGVPAAGDLRVLASDADRDAAAGLLNGAFAEGRLTADEHGERLSAGYQARTWQQLRQLTADLPAMPGPPGQRMARPGMSGGLDWCLLCLLLVVCPPVGIAWLWLSWRRLGASAGGEAGAVSDPAVLAGLPLAGRPGTGGL